MRKADNSLCILYVLAALTGIGYFIIAMQNGTLVLWGYSNEIKLNNGLLPRIINYSKDIFTVLLAAYLFAHQNKRNLMKTEWFYLFCGILIGAALIYISDNSLLTLIGGIRAYLLSFVVFCYCWRNALSVRFFHRFSRVVELMILFQLGGVGIQVILIGGHVQLGAGAYRLLGLFTNAGTLSFFSLGALIFLSYVYLTNLIKNIEYYVFSFILLFLTLVSGSRACFLYILLLIWVTIIEKSRINAKSKLYLIPVSVVMILAIVLPNLTNYVSRGNLMESGQGRIKAWYDLLLLEPWQILLGTGLGAGTNSARSLGASSIAMDSSLTVIIAQYGLWGITIFLLQTLKVFINLYRRSKHKWYIVVLMTIISLILLSGSLFEQYTLMIPLIIVLCNIYKGDRTIIYNEK